MVRDMLVIDRVEHHIVDHVDDVGDLEHEGAVIGEQQADALHDIRHVVDMGEDVVGAEQLGFALFGLDACRQRAGEEVRERRDAVRGCGGRDVARRVDALDAHSLIPEGLQQRAVIAAHLGDKAAFRNRKRGDDRVRIALEVLDQAERHRCAIRIVAEQDVGIDDIEVLQMSAIEAQVAVEGIEVLRFAQAVRGDEGVADRRWPDRQDMVERGRSTQAAICLVLDVLHGLAILKRKFGTDRELRARFTGPRRSWRPLRARSRKLPRRGTGIVR